MNRHFLTILLYISTISIVYAQITYDGDINEAAWNTALSTSAGGPSPGFGAGHEINAIYARGTATDINFAIAGNVQDGNRILLFIDSKSGGYANCDFGRNGSPGGLSNLNQGISFDIGFFPDYCLAIGTVGSDYFFNLYTLSGTAGDAASGGPDLFLGDQTATTIGVAPANSDNTKGFEVAISKTSLGYTGGSIRVMAMYTGDSGFLSNQFLNPAGSGDGNYGDGAVTFASASPSPITIAEALLPVELTSFSATPEKNQVVLNWQTAQEINNDYFQIERKTAQSSDWEIIGQEQGEGNSETTVRYSFTDTKPVNGINYYRLKQTDFDGQFAYSEMVSAKVQETILIDIFPNPTASELTIVTPVDFTEGEIQLYDASGKMITSTKINERNSLNLSNLNTGIYFFRLLDKNGNVVAENKVRKL